MEGDPQCNIKLPAGWIRVKSKSRPDKEYFHNKSLNLSLWSLKDLQKFQRSSNGSVKTPTKSPTKNANVTPKKPSSGTAAHSKNIKKNVAKDRMNALQKVLAVERGNESKQTSSPDKKRQQQKNNNAKTLDTFKDVAIITSKKGVEKNFALQRMNNLNKQLAKEVTIEKNRATKFEASSSPKMKVPVKIVDKQVEQETEANITNDESVMMDISFEQPSEELLEEYEPMDWEDIPEQEVIQEVQKIRTTEISSNSTAGLAQIKRNGFMSSQIEFYVIVDTNVLLSNIDFIKEIKGKMFKDIGKATIYLPYIVLCELDRLKIHEEKVARLARRAISFIDECFRVKDSFVMGQSAVESLQKQIIPIESGDDEILNCCLQIQEMTQKIILLTNDKNLRNKAFVNKIEAQSRDMLNFIDYNLKNDIKFD